MGTKQALAPAVTEVIGQAQSGTLLDVFSGMCSVGEAIGTARQVWSNDVQFFASEVARALFTSNAPPLSPLECADIHFQPYRQHRQKLQNIFASSLLAENNLLAADSFAQFEAREKQLSLEIQRDALQCRLRLPHLFSITYAGNYFGVQQAIEADAIVHALTSCRINRKTSLDQSRWGHVALGRALLKIANSTGHFAQFLKPKETTLRRHITLRKRSLWTEWLISIGVMAPVGSAGWRRHNKAFRQDCLRLLPVLAKSKAEVSVIYADPPYTDDQYSRYYHVLETLIRYDYPQVNGAGLYRPNRFRTPFSLKSLAADAMNKLISGAAKTGADLVLSYPANGLLVRAGHDIRSMLRKSFARVEVADEISHKHSTFGASKGASHSQTTELIYFARAT